MYLQKNPMFATNNMILISPFQNST